MKFIIRVLVFTLLFSMPMGILLGMIRKPKVIEKSRIDLREEYRESILDQIKDPYSQFNRDELTYYAQSASRVQFLSKRQLGNNAPEVNITNKGTGEVLSNNKKLEKNKQQANNIIIPSSESSIDLQNILPDIAKEENKEVIEYTVDNIPTTADVAKKTIDETKKKKGFWGSIKDFFTLKKSPVKTKEPSVNDDSDSLYSNKDIKEPEKEQNSYMQENNMVTPDTIADFIPEEKSAQFPKVAADKKPEQEPDRKSKKNDNSSKIELPSLDFLSDDILKID